MNTPIKWGKHAFIHVFVLSLFMPKISYGQITPENEYTWLKPHLNRIQFYNKSAIEQLYKSWHASSNDRFTIVHIGDSHIQPDILTSETRKILQGIHGDAGKGMIFPNCIAQTYSHFTVSCKYKGEWTYGKSLILPPKVTSRRTRHGMPHFRPLCKLYYNLQ